MIKNTSHSTFFDVIIIGAGISGIDAAYHIQDKCKNKTYAIFEARDNIGGTWDLFKYPGIRSDSDMQTFSYSFKPWIHKNSISDANTILNYLSEAVEENDIKKHIRFNHKIIKADWSTKNKNWTITAQNTKTNESLIVTTNFLFLCTGYYDYDEGYTPQYKGLERFKGDFVHPQKWTSDIDYTNKKVVVIGSGATAVTLVPTMAEKAAHVTMLQRSPSYILSRPMEDKFANFVHSILPPKIAHFFGRWKNILMSMFMYSYSRRNPEGVKQFIMKQIKKEMGDDYDVDTHFNPSYDPWDQRICVVPDNDLFDIIKQGKASIETDHIETFTGKGIQLKSGKELEADLIVSATGLKLKTAGGIAVHIDGKLIKPSEMISYKGIMLKDIPNAAVVIGYTNASWTLKADLTCLYVCRLLNYMEKHNKKVCTPVFKDGNIKTEPIIDLSSGYVARSLDVLPKQGSEFPWKLHQNYVKDMMILKYKKIDDGYLKFE